MNRETMYAADIAERLMDVAVENGMPPYGLLNIDVLVKMHGHDDYLYTTVERLQRMGFQLVDRVVGGVRASCGTEFRWDDETGNWRIERIEGYNDKGAIG